MTGSSTYDDLAALKVKFRRLGFYRPASFRVSIQWAYNLTLALRHPWMVPLRNLVARWRRNFDLDAWYGRDRDISSYRGAPRRLRGTAIKRILRLFWFSFHAYGLAVVLAIQAQRPTSPESQRRRNRQRLRFDAILCNVRGGRVVGRKREAFLLSTSTRLDIPTCSHFQCFQYAMRLMGKPYRTHAEQSD